MPEISESSKARSIILSLLSRGVWYAPHEIYTQLTLQRCYISAKSSGARRHDLSKPQFGGHNVTKRLRPGTDFWEYQILDQKGAA